jgi:hypothetical protein
LHLNTIPQNRKQPVRKSGSDRDTILADCASCQHQHLIDRRIEIKTTLSRRRFLDVFADPIDDVSGAIGIANDTVDRFPDLANVRRPLVQKIHRRTGVVARAGDRLRDLVGQRGGQFSHHAHAVHVREICLQLAEPLPLLLRAFAFRHIDVCPDNLEMLSVGGGHKMGSRFEISNCSIR